MIAVRRCPEQSRRHLLLLESGNPRHPGRPASPRPARLPSSHGRSDAPLALPPIAPCPTRGVARWPAFGPLGRAIDLEFRIEALPACRHPTATVSPSPGRASPVVSRTGPISRARPSWSTRTTPGFPPLWILRHYGDRNAAWPRGEEPFSLEPGQPLELRYRLWMHQGDAEAGGVAEAWRAFSGY